MFCFKCGKEIRRGEASSTLIITNITPIEILPFCRKCTADIIRSCSKEERE